MYRLLNIIFRGTSHLAVLLKFIYQNIVTGTETHTL